MLAQVGFVHLLVSHSHMIIPFFYLIATVMVATLASLTDDDVKHTLGMLLLWSWTVANFTVYRWGFDGAVDYLAIGELILAVITAAVGWSNQSRLALIIVGLFGAQETIQIVSRVLEQQGSYSYYLALNLAFIAQLAVLGGASLGPALRRLGNLYLARGARRHLPAYRAHK